jgi:acetoacetyl-CoA reductase
MGQSKNGKMARVALVTGGTLGIGAAISEALPDAGYCVAATYAGNDAAAKAFEAKTAAGVYSWDAGDFEACAADIRKVEAARDTLFAVMQGATA